MEKRKKRQEGKEGRGDEVEKEGGERGAYLGRPVVERCIRLSGEAVASRCARTLRPHATRSQTRTRANTRMHTRTEHTHTRKSNRKPRQRQVGMPSASPSRQSSWDLESSWDSWDLESEADKVDCLVVEVRAGEDADEGVEAGRSAEVQHCLVVLCQQEHLPRNLQRQVRGLMRAAEQAGKEERVGGEVALGAHGVPHVAELEQLCKDSLVDACVAAAEQLLLLVARDVLADVEMHRRPPGFKRL
jgi:hypothetical protein